MPTRLYESKICALHRLFCRKMGMSNPHADLFSELHFLKAKHRSKSKISSLNIPNRSDPNVRQE